MVSFFGTDEFSNFALGGFFGGILLIISLIAAIPGIFKIICVWKVYVKAGQRGWESIVPIYNTVVLFKMTNINPIVILWILLPLVGSIIFLVYHFKAQISLAKVFGKSTGFAIGLIFLPIIFYAILAFDSSVYNKSSIM